MKLGSGRGAEQDAPEGTEVTCRPRLGQAQRVPLDVATPVLSGWRLTTTGLVLARERWAWLLAGEALRAVGEGRDAGYMDQREVPLIHSAIGRVRVERQRPESEHLPWGEALARLMVLAEMHPDAG